MVVADIVAVGKKGKKPLGTVKIEGQPIKAISRKQKAWERKIALLEQLEADLLEKQTEVEEYIEQTKKIDKNNMSISLHRRFDMGNGSNANEFHFSLRRPFLLQKTAAGCLMIDI